MAVLNICNVNWCHYMFFGAILANFVAHDHVTGCDVKQKDPQRPQLPQVKVSNSV